MSFDILTKELRFALRLFSKRPGFTAVAVVTLALGAGANTAVFSVVNGVLLTPLPYEEPDDLITVDVGPDPNGRFGPMSFPDLADIEREAESIETLVGINTASMTLTRLGEPTVIAVTRVTNGLLATFRTRPFLGRDIRIDEFGENAPAVAVLSHSFWQSRFGGRADVLGEVVTLNDITYEVVGVAPAGFDYPRGTELWIPRRMSLEDCGRGCHSMRTVGRLARGASLEAASAEVEAIAANLSSAYPDSNTDKLFAVRSLQQQIVGEVRAGLSLLLGCVALVVLIACTNVANLQLARAFGRTVEVAIRTAVGAGRARLLVQSLIESAVLSAMGASLGLGLAFGIVHWLPELAPSVPRIESIQIDGLVLLFALVTSVAVTFIFGAAPAVALLRSSIRVGLGHTGPNAGGDNVSRRRSRSLLLATEMALSALLLVAAGLLFKSFASLYAVDVGFETRNILRFNLNLPEVRYSTLEVVRDFYRRFESRVAALPGAEAVGSVWSPPLGRGYASGTVLVAGWPEPSPSEEVEAYVHSVGPGWLETMRIQVLKGRGLEGQDELGPPVALVNEAFARTVFSREEPLQQRVRVNVDLGYGSPEWRIVGVLKDVRSRALKREPGPEIFVPHGKFGPESMTITVRASDEPTSLLPAIRNVLRDLDPDVPMYRIETMAEAMQREVAPTRFYLLLIGAFAALAVLLTSVGLYGVVSYSSARRRREIGLRVALGAQRRRIERMVVAQGLMPAVLGLAAGLVAAYFTGRVLESTLFEVNPRDPLIFGGVGLLLGAVAAVAATVPAVRASRVAPADVLRAE